MISSHSFPEPTTAPRSFLLSRFPALSDGRLGTCGETSFLSLLQVKKEKRKQEGLDPPGALFTTALAMSHMLSDIGDPSHLDTRAFSYGYYALVFQANTDVAKEFVSTLGYPGEGPRWKKKNPPLSFSVITRPVRQQGNRVEIEEKEKKRLTLIVFLLLSLKMKSRKRKSTQSVFL